jgi:hypothetical protein
MEGRKKKREGDDVGGRRLVWEGKRYGHVTPHLLYIDGQQTDSMDILELSFFGVSLRATALE